MRRAWILVPPLAVLAALVPAVRAEDGPPKPPADKAEDAKKAATTLRVERAKALVRDLETALARAKAAAPVDAQLLQSLFAALETARALAKAATPAELTDGEKQAVLDEAKKDEPAPAAQNALTDFQERALAKALEGADLDEEETLKARKVIGDWYRESMGSWGDSKKTSDLKRKRDDELEKALGKKARKVINNLNAMGPGRR
jgi:hypothetical protein